MTQRISRRGGTVVAAALAAGLAIPLLATSASAGSSCLYSSYDQYGANGYARTTDVNGQCARVGAQAGFATPGVSSTIWTSWYYGADVAQTSTVSNFVAGHHSGS